MKAVPWYIPDTSQPSDQRNSSVYLPPKLTSKLSSRLGVGPTPSRTSSSSGSIALGGAKSGVVDEVVEISLRYVSGSILADLIRATDILAPEGVVGVTRNGCSDTIYTLRSPIEPWPLCSIHNTSLELCIPVSLSYIIKQHDIFRTMKPTNFFIIIFSMTSPES